jgi:hypothetical protein
VSERKDCNYRIHLVLKTNGSRSRKVSARKPKPGLTTGAVQTRKTLWDDLDEIWAEVPDEELRKLPTDLSAQHDHYIYGLPRKASRWQPCEAAD